MILTILACLVFLASTLISRPLPDQDCRFIFPSQESVLVSLSDALKYLEGAHEYIRTRSYGWFLGMHSRGYCNCLLCNLPSSGGFFFESIRLISLRLCGGPVPSPLKVRYTHGTNELHKRPASRTYEINITEIISLPRHTLYRPFPGCTYHNLRRHAPFPALP